MAARGYTNSPPGTSGHNTFKCDQDEPLLQAENRGPSDTASVTGLPMNGKQNFDENAHIDGVTTISGKSPQLTTQLSYDANPSFDPFWALGDNQLQNEVGNNTSLDSTFSPTVEFEQMVAPLDILESISPGSSIGSGLNIPHVGSNQPNPKLSNPFNKDQHRTPPGSKYSIAEKPSGEVHAPGSGTATPISRLRFLDTQRSDEGVIKPASRPILRHYNTRVEANNSSRPTSGNLHIVPEEDDVFLDVMRYSSDIDDIGNSLEQETSFNSGHRNPSAVVHFDDDSMESMKSVQFLEVPQVDDFRHIKGNISNNASYNPERRRTLAHLGPETDFNENVPVQEKCSVLPRKLSMPVSQQMLPSQTRRPSKSYTVIHYGRNVGKEASTTVPTGYEQVDRLDFYDIEDPSKGSVPFELQEPKDVVMRQLVRQLSEDRHSVISVPGQRNRLLSIQHINQRESGNHDFSFDLNDTTDLSPIMETQITIESNPSQETVDGSKLNKDTAVKAMAQFGKLFAMRKKNRLVHKDGSINVRPANISKRACQFLLDIFTTLLDISWRYVWTLFVIVFVVSWLFFALVWWLVCYSNGDFEQLVDEESQRPLQCVDGVVDFGSAFLFSVETQHTIGYGTRAITVHCPIAYIVIMAQSLLGVVIQCILAGVVFAKLAKPKNRSETIMFSKKAAICVEDGCYCLMFRVGDMRRSQLVGCNMHAFLVREHGTKEGRKMEFKREPLEVVSEAEDYDQYLFLAWPTKIIHRITSDSPLYNVTRDGLLAEQFEIIIILEGTIESSGMITQIRTSYLPSEIEWGQRFRNLLTEQKSGGIMEIDFSNFSKTEAQPNMPSVSACEYYKATAVNTMTPRDRSLSHRSNASRGF